MFSRVLSCIEALTISQSAAFPDGFAQALARELLARAGRDGSAAVALEVLAGALSTTPAAVVAALQSLYAAGLLAFGVVPVSTGGAWVLVWFAGFAADGAAVLTGNVSSEGANGCLFVCSPDLPGSEYINKQTNNTRGRAGAGTRPREGGDASPAVVTGNASGETARIVALLTDQAVTRGLVAGGLVVGAMVPDKARSLAREVVAAGHDFDFVLANVCEWRRQVEAGRLHAPIPALVTRLRRGFVGSITTADRAEAWFLRHAPQTFDLGIAPAVEGVDPAVVAGNISSDAPAGDPEWDRFLALLPAIGETQIADLLEGSAAIVSADRLVVRLAGRGAAWVDWLRDRASRRLADLLSGELGRVVVLEFVTAAAGDD